MSLYKLLMLSRKRPVDPEGNEYRSKKVVGADKGHWRVEYCYEMQGGYSYTYFWERMSDSEMDSSHCYADDHKDKEKSK